MSFETIDQDDLTGELFVTDSGAGYFVYVDEGGGCPVDFHTWLFDRFPSQAGKSGDHFGLVRITVERMEEDAEVEEEGPTREEVFEYLDDLRESGETNMFGARMYILQQFPMLTAHATNLLTEWMNTFSERYPREEE